MAKLNDINLPETDSKKARTNITTITVRGDIVTRFNEARDAIKQAEAVVDMLKPELVDAGLEAVFENNCQPDKAVISSVNLADTETGQTVQFTWTRKNLKCSKPSVTEAFSVLRTVEGKKANINDYVYYVTVAEFDGSVFMVNGKFNEERYAAFVNALQDVSDQFGVANPLSCGKALKVKPDFHDRRWKDFDPETNRELQTVLPTQVGLEPIRQEAS
jgi:hypothetical protein